MKCFQETKLKKLPKFSENSEPYFAQYHGKARRMGKHITTTQTVTELLQPNQLETMDISMASMTTDRQAHRWMRTTNCAQKMIVKVIVKMMTPTATKVQILNLVNDLNELKHFNN